MLASQTFSDQDLTALLKEGNEEAFSKIFNRYQSLLFDFAYKRIHDKDEAKDIVQEIFVRLWNNRADLEIRISLRSYLYRAVLNEMLNALRHKVIQEEYVNSLQEMINLDTRQADYHIRET